MVPVLMLFEKFQLGNNNNNNIYFSAFAKRRFINVVSLILYSRVAQVRWAKFPTARVTSS